MDRKAESFHRLFVAHANYEAAKVAKEKNREQLDRAIQLAHEAGLSKAEIGRALGMSGQRVGQIIQEA
jgi:DNA-binding transcriptional regulator LsrR (DeoR family)